MSRVIVDHSFYCIRPAVLPKLSAWNMTQMRSTKPVCTAGLVCEHDPLDGFLNTPASHFGLLFAEDTSPEHTAAAGPSAQATLQAGTASFP